MSLPHFEDAQEAIKQVYKDETTDRETTRVNLEELRELCDDYIAALDDADNKYNYIKEP